VFGLLFKAIVSWTGRASTKHGLRSGLFEKCEMTRWACNEPFDASTEWQFRMSFRRSRDHPSGRFPHGARIQTETPPPHSLDGLCCAPGVKCPRVGRRANERKKARGRRLPPFGLSGGRESMKRMIILRGNSAAAGKYPDEQGSKIAWPYGALHVDAAKEFARRKGYEGVVLDKPGQPQNQHSPQANAAVDLFLNDNSIAAFYGFSGGGYNVKHILDRLATTDADELWRIELVVVLGAPRPNKRADFLASNYNGDLKKKGIVLANWDVIYMENPDSDDPVVPKGAMAHMFGPEWLLSKTPAP
jgi:hypothetical protein